jgi:type VI protein secretion system component VasF
VNDHILKVDLYSGCDSDATSNTIVAMEKHTIAKSLLFRRVATIVFSSCCLVILIIFFYDFRWQLLSDGSDITRKLK